MIETAGASHIEGLASEEPDNLTNEVDVRSKKKPVSGWIWLSFIWLFTASTRSVGTWLAGGHLDRAATALADEAGSPVDRIVLITLILLGAFVLASRSTRTKRILLNNQWLVLLFLYMGLSTIWSNFPGITFRRWIRCTGMLMMVLIVLTEEDPFAAIRALLRRLFLVFVPLSVAAIKYFRYIGVVYNWSGTEEMWVGLSVHKNNLGQVAMCSGLFSSWQVLRRWPMRKLTLDLLILAMTLWLLRGSKNSHSSSAIVGFIVGLTILLAVQLVRKRPEKAKQFVVLSLIALFLIAPLVYFTFSLFDTTPVQAVLQATGRDMTLTDRTLIWTDLLANAKKSPIVGVGYGAFWVGPIGYNLYPMKHWSEITPEWRPNEGHNGFLDVYIDLGFVGIFILLMLLRGAFGGSLDDLQHNFQLGSLRLTLLTSIVLNNFTESSFFKGTHALWFLFLLVAINVPRTSASEKYPENSDNYLDHQFA